MKAIFEIFGPNVKYTAQCQDNTDLSRKVTDERFSSTHVRVDHVTFVRVMLQFWHSRPLNHLFHLVGGALTRGKEGH